MFLAGRLPSVLYSIASPSRHFLQVVGYCWGLSGVKPDEVTYNLAISACGGCENSTVPAELLQQAFNTAAEMRAAGLTPTMVTYTTLLGLCARAGNGKVAQALYQARSACQQCSPHPALKLVMARLALGMYRHEAGKVQDRHAWAEVVPSGKGVKLCCMHAAPIKWTMAAQELKDSGVRLDKTVLTALISALGAGGMPQEALSVFKTMVRGHPSALLLHGLPLWEGWT